MTQPIPDLWHLQEDALRFYTLYLARLQENALHERVVVACRRIRQYAAHGPGPKKGLFTFSFEIDALCDLGQYRTALRQFRSGETIASGRPHDLASREWTARDDHVLAFYYAPLLYFLGRYRQGCALLETALGFGFGRERVRSHDLLCHVYNGDAGPRHRCRVTLWHFYEQLGKNLGEWPHWERFIDGFHPRLFRLAGVSREELLAVPDRLAILVTQLEEVLAERGISGVGGGGERDLLDSPSTVRKREQTIQKQKQAFMQESKPRREKTNARLVELFPELRERLG